MNRIDIIFSFDTTGSMSGVIKSVRNNLSGTIDRLLTEVEGINIGLIAHGDYGDYENRKNAEEEGGIDNNNGFFWFQQPTDDGARLKEFIVNAPNTNGYDADECYEYVLYRVNQLEWKSPIRLLIVIGDADPHPKGYRLRQTIPNVPLIRVNDGDGKEGAEQAGPVFKGGKLNIDWKEEASKLRENGVMIFSCDCSTDEVWGWNRGKPPKDPFYKTICDLTQGFHFKFEDASKQSFPHYMVAICLKAVDGAEGIELLRKEREELIVQLGEISLEDNEPGLEQKREEIKRQIEELTPQPSANPFSTPMMSTTSLTNAFVDLATYERDYHQDTYTSFSARTQESVKRVRDKRNYKSRLEQYEEELNARADVDEKTKDFARRLGNWSS